MISRHMVHAEDLVLVEHCFGSDYLRLEGPLPRIPRCVCIWSLMAMLHCGSLSRLQEQGGMARQPLTNIPAGSYFCP